MALAHLIALSCARVVPQSCGF